MSQNNFLHILKWNTQTKCTILIIKERMSLSINKKKKSCVVTEVTSFLLG